MDRLHRAGGASTSPLQLLWHQASHLSHPPVRPAAYDPKAGRLAAPCEADQVGTLAQVVRLPGDAFNHKFALDAWGSAPRGGMISIIMAIGLIELISNRCGPARTCIQRRRVPVGCGRRCGGMRASSKLAVLLSVLPASEGSHIHRCFWRRRARLRRDAAAEMVSPAQLRHDPRRHVRQPQPQGARLFPRRLTTQAAPRAEDLVCGAAVSGVWEQRDASECSGACSAGPDYVSFQEMGPEVMPWLDGDVRRSAGRIVL